MVVARPKVLVTGATGFFGQRIVKRLIENGYPVRALVRKRSNLGALNQLGVEIASGDLADASSILAAVDGVDAVVHAAAGTSGTSTDSETATIQGTRNVIAACKAHQVKKLIYISSCNVYEVAGYAENQVVTEDAQLERFPLRRGHYTSAKLQAENLVNEAMERDEYAVVVLRPGTIYGPGAEVYTKIMGVSIGRRVFVVFGNGDSELPLVNVENAADAVVDCIGNGAADNQVFNVVDQDVVTKKTYMNRVIKPMYPKATVIYFPMVMLRGLTWVQEKLLGIIGRQPFLSVYRLMSSQNRIRYSTSRIEDAVGWRSRIGFEQAAEQLVSEQERAAPAD